jgi:hypothetical protein
MPGTMESKVLYGYDCTSAKEILDSVDTELYSEHLHYLFLPGSTF